MCPVGVGGCWGRRKEPRSDMPRKVWVRGILVIPKALNKFCPVAILEEGD